MINSPSCRKLGQRSRKIAAYAILGLFVTAMTTSLPAVAHADDDHGRGHGHGRGHEWHDHEDHAHRYWGQPQYVAAPPVVYAPPPMQESPGLNLIVPLHFH